MTHCAAFYRYIKKHFWELPQAECTKAICSWCQTPQQTSNDLYNHIQFMDQYFPEWLERWEEAESGDGTAIAVPMAEGTTRLLRRLFEKEVDIFNQVMTLITEQSNTPEVQRIIAGVRFTDVERTPPPEGEYDVVVMDPPWEYGDEYHPSTRRGTIEYPSLTVEQIRDEYKPPLTENGILWLWTTNQYIHEAFHLLEAWKLEYKAVFVWVKPTMGVGKIIRHRAEFCLLAFKGNPHWYNTDQDNIINGPIREHSRKPDEFYELVNSLCAGTKLDMFAREPRDDWEVWGAEVEKFGNIDEAR